MLSGEEVKKIGCLVVGPGQRAVVLSEDQPRPWVLSEGSHKLRGKALHIVLISTGQRESLYGVPKGSVFERLGFSGKLILTIRDGPNEVEWFVERIVLGQGMKTLDGVVHWLVHNHLVTAFKEAAKGKSEEEFMSASWERLAENVKSVVNSRIMRCGLYLESVSVLWWARDKPPGT